MNWPSDIAYFFGGALLANSIPHIVAGLMGKGFQTPFAKPPGQGLSTAATNVAWGFVNLAVAYGLIVWVGAFDIHALDNAGAAFAGMLLLALGLSRRFGRFNGGNAPGQPPA